MNDTWYELLNFHWNSLVFYAMFFSSPELKAQVMFSDQNLYVVRRWRCRKLFKSSSPKPLGLFQPNLAQTIIG